MKYHVLERGNASLDLYLSDEGVTRATQADGVNPNTVRAVFDEVFGKGQARLDVVTSNGTFVDLTGFELPDLFYWSWVPAFSERARRLMLELGAVSGDFSLCEIGSNADHRCFLHLPVKTYDRLDVDHSRFKFSIPTTPPIPYGVQQLTMRSGTEPMPHCFRLEVPGTTQVLGELIVSEEFRARWARDQFIGAEFRCVS